MENDKQAADIAEAYDASYDRQVVELQSLFELSKTLNASLNTKKILDTLLLTPMGRMMITKGAIFMQNGEKRFRVERAKGLAPELIGKSFELELDADEPILTSEIADKATRDLLLRFNLQIICPIQSNEQIIGLIALGKKLGGAGFSHREIEYLNSLANLSAPALDNSRRLHAMQDLNRQLDQKNQKLNTLAEISRELNATLATLDKAKIANSLAYAVMGEMMVQRCLIFMVDQAKNFDFLAAKGVTRLETMQFYSKKSLLKSLIAHRQPVLLPQSTKKTLRDAAYKDEVLLFVPMLNRDRVAGGMLLGSRLNDASFDEVELEFLGTLGNTAMISLENARLFQETLEKQRIEEELSIARDIQRRLLPAAPPHVPGFDFAGINISTHQVGGDYYDFLMIDATHVAIAIGDVSGKGVPASLLMANLQASLHAMIHANWPLSQLVSRMNNIIFSNTSIDKFITFFVGIIDTESRSLTYVNAGHNPPILKRASGELCELQVGGLILGMMGNVPYQQATIQLLPGDDLVLFTDGVSEARNVQDQEFTEERIGRLLLKADYGSAAELIEILKNAVRDFTVHMPQLDDITMLAVRVLKEGEQDAR